MEWLRSILLPLVPFFLGIIALLEVIVGIIEVRVYRKQNKEGGKRG